MDQSTFDSSYLTQLQRGIGAISHAADNFEACQTDTSESLDLKNLILNAPY